MTPGIVFSARSGGFACRADGEPDRIEREVSRYGKGLTIPANLEGLLPATHSFCVIRLSSRFRTDARTTEMFLVRPVFPILTASHQCIARCRLAEWLGHRLRDCETPIATARLPNALARRGALFFHPDLSSLILVSVCLRVFRLPQTRLEPPDDLDPPCYPPASKRLNFSRSLIRVTASSNWESSSSSVSRLARRPCKRRANSRRRFARM